MPLSQVIKRHADHPRRIAWLSSAAGVVFFLLFSTITLFVIHHKRAQLHDRLANASKAYMQGVFNNLKKSLLPLLLLAADQESVDEIAIAAGDNVY